MVIAFQKKWFGVWVPLKPDVEHLGGFSFVPVGTRPDSGNRPDGVTLGCQTGLENALLCQPGAEQVVDNLDAVRLVINTAQASQVIELQAVGLLQPSCRFGKIFRWNGDGDFVDGGTKDGRKPGRR